MRVDLEGPRTLALAAARSSGRDGAASVMMTEQYFAFPWAALETGRSYAVTRPPGFGVEVLEGHDRSAQRLRFTTARPLAESVLCAWTPDPDPRRHWLERRLQSRLRCGATGAR
jgi:hypothetical protein